MTRGARCLLLGWLLGGCYAGADRGDGEDGAETGEGGASEGSTDAGEDDGVAACEPAPAAPLLRRLTVPEYQASVRDLLGVDTEDLADRFPVDATVAGFSNNAATQTVLLGHVHAYQDVAEIVAARVLDDPSRREAVVGCTPGPGADDACLRGFIERFAGAAYRRPVDAAEVDRLATLAASSSDASGFGGVALVLRAVLQSPRFLFRIERGVPDPDDPERRWLDGHELATRLSYFLWQTTPDAWLLQRAADGALDDADGVAATAREMLADPRAREAIAGFAAGWLRLAALDDLGRDPAAFPEWSPELRDAMRAEIVAMVDDATLGGGGLGELYEGRRAWLGPELAALYGLPAPAGDGLVPVELPDGDDRGGLLGTAAMLALTTPSGITSPVRRGMFVWDALLCSPLPPPPPEVIGELPPPEELPKEDALEQHRSDPSCSGCHDLLDPIGIGLERYDALGRRRTLDEGGQPVIEQGWVPGLDDAEFEGAGQLGQRLLELPATQRCFATQVLRWSQGRTETADDACLLDALEAGVAAGDFATVVATLVRSDEFRSRPAEE